MKELAPGRPFPETRLSVLGGEDIVLSGADRWTLIVVYRGRHCGRCKPYLDKLEALQGDLAALGVRTIAVSADPRDRAEADLEEFGWSFPVAFDLTPEDMRRMGLFISDSLGGAEPSRLFAEPGLFVINGDGLVQVVAVSNSPSVRPELETVVDGIGAVQRKGLAIRGMAS